MRQRHTKADSSTRPELHLRSAAEVLFNFCMLQHSCLRAFRHRQIKALAAFAPLILRGLADNVTGHPRLMAHYLHAQAGAQPHKHTQHTSDRGCVWPQPQPAGQRNSA